MGWKLKPQNTRDIQAYDFVRQFYHRFCELNCAVNADYLWPQGNKRYFTGNVVAAELDDSDPDPANWTVTITAERTDGTATDWESTYPTGCTGTSRWVDVDCPGYAPVRYDVVIEGSYRNRAVTVDGNDYTYRIPDETMVVRAEITASDDDTLTVKALPLVNAVMGKIIDSLASLADKTFHIMRARSVGQSLHPMERWIQWPNGYPTQKQILDGTGARTFTINGQSVSVIGRMVLWSGTVQSGDDHGLTDDTDDLSGKNAVGFDPNKPQSWAANKWKDQEALVYDTRGLLHREKLLRGNDRKSLFWKATAAPAGHVSEWTPSGKYLIVEPDCRGLPDREPEAAKYWYGGYTEFVYGHHPHDDVVDLPWPVDSIFYSEGATIFDCEVQRHDALDVDIHTTDDDVCAEQGPDFFSAPHLYKSRRALQLTARAFVPQFIDPDTIGQGKAGASYYTLATAFRKRGINSTIATITGASGGTVTHSGVTLPKPTPASPTPTSLPCFWALIDHDRVTYKGSAAGVITATTIGNTDIDDTDIGKSLVICWGESSYYPREVFRLYGQTVAIPAWDSSPGGHGLVDPPQTFVLADDGCFGVQEYIHRNKSTTYLERNFLGFAQEGGQAFIKDELARYVGSHLYTPDIGLNQPGTEAVISGQPDEQRTYWDHFTIGQHWSTSKQFVIEAAKTGAADGGGKNYLTDTSKNWYRSVWYQIAADVMRVEQGRATQDGSSTSLFCADKTDDEDQTPHCWWDPARFVGFGSAYEHFPIRIRQTRGAAVSEYRTFITSSSQDSSGTTIHFRDIGSPVKADDEFFIDEPYELNRWQDRALKITKHDSGNVYLAIIKYSDVDTLFFDDLPTGVIVEFGDTYEIVEIPTGSVLRWLDENGVTGWVRPIVGTVDPRKGLANGKGIAGGIYKESPWNLPTTVKTFRASMLGDYSGVQWSEIYEVTNLLHIRRYNGGWTARGECNVAAWSGDTEAPIVARPLPGGCSSSPCHETYPHGLPTAPYCDTADGYRAAYHQALGSYEGCPDEVLSTNDPPHLFLFASRITVDTCEDGIGAAADTNYSYYDGNIPLCRKVPVTVQLWVLGEKPDCTETTFTHCAFQSNGAPIADGTWTHWDDPATDENGDWLSIKFGDLWSNVVRPEPPPEPDVGHQYRAGFDVAGHFALVDHDPFMELRD